MSRQRRKGRRPFADPQTAKQFREIVWGRLCEASPDWRDRPNPTIANLANSLGLKTFEGRRWDSRAVRGLIDATERERRNDVSRADRIAEARTDDRNALLERATMLLKAIGEHADLDFIYKEFAFLSLTLLEDERDEPAICIVLHRAERYLVERKHPDALVLNQARGDP